MKFFQDTKLLFKLLLKQGSGYGSRTFVALLFACTIVFIALVELFTDLTTSEPVWWGLITTYGAAHGLSTLTTNKALDTKSKAVTDVTGAESPKESSAAAKDILNSDKP